MRRGVKGGSAGLAFSGLWQRLSTSPYSPSGVLGSMTWLRGSMNRSSLRGEVTAMKAVESPASIIRTFSN